MDRELVIILILGLLVIGLGVLLVLIPAEHFFGVIFLLIGIAILAIATVIGW